MKTYEHECCEQVEVHEELLSIVRSQMPEEGTLYDLAELFKVFGDSTRIRILFMSNVSAFSPFFTEKNRFLLAFFAA